ncbi:hypothetical protein JT55_10205 [Rhodovulum sp. NI22]|nr:hypothetical protein JT55_10205 [Rhodovulum sp. NI22]
MALTVGINSYIDVTDATAYFADRLYVDDWTGATDSDKSKALLMARRTIDRQAFHGYRTDPDQLLAWPRSDIPGIDAATVPQDILDAQCELALAFLREDLTADDSTRGVKRLQAGSVAIEYDGSAPTKSLPDAVLAALQPFLDGAIVDTGNSLKMVM